MYDSGKIITGLIIFIALFTSPFWYNLSNGKALIKPNPVLPTKENQKECVENIDFMRSNHMVLLNDWRNEVVRTGNRNFISENGKHFNMSLTNTCLNCHQDKAQFCDQCHNYMGISNYCWDCHNEPQVGESNL
ncbi:MAG TPA: sulfate reduction electron transfer complex DsrMKJOP subunit DsrJ [Ignavibacteriaceae bacterium]|nr:sulfate reduction electron transfer complex DsrMKJOP subunit DsrJ [Ignavibacteriaceae bacterium]